MYQVNVVQPVGLMLSYEYCEIRFSMVRFLVLTLGKINNSK